MKRWTILLIMLAVMMGVIPARADTVPAGAVPSLVPPMFGSVVHSKQRLVIGETFIIAASVQRRDDAPDPLTVTLDLQFSDAITITPLLPISNTPMLCDQTTCSVVLTADQPTAGLSVRATVRGDDCTPTTIFTTRLTMRAGIDTVISEDASFFFGRSCVFIPLVLR